LGGDELIVAKLFYYRGFSDSTIPYYYNFNIPYFLIHSCNKDFIKKSSTARLLDPDFKLFSRVLRRNPVVLLRYHFGLTGENEEKGEDLNRGVGLKLTISDLGYKRGFFLRRGSEGDLKRSGRGEEGIKRSEGQRVFSNSRNVGYG
jgi:hypothetical protein